MLVIYVTVFTQLIYTFRKINRVKHVSSISLTKMVKKSKTGSSLKYPTFKPSVIE